MSSGKQPSRALLIAAGLLTQLIGAACFVLGLASIPVVHDLKGGMSGVIASVIASLAAIVCGTLVWRGRLVPLALAAGLDVGFGIGLPRGGSAVGAMLRMLPADEASTAETFVMIGAITMFVAAILCVISVPSALKLRQWARDELATAGASQLGMPVMNTFAMQQLDGSNLPPLRPAVDELAPTRERPRFNQNLPLPLPPEPEPRSGNTLRGFSAQKLMPTQVLNIGPAKRGGKPVIIIGVAVTLIAIGIIVITAAGGSSVDEVAGKSGSSDEVTSVISGSAGTPAVDLPPKAGRNGTAAVIIEAQADAGQGAPAIPPVEDFVTRFHAALGTAAAADLALLFDTKAFAFGVEANDLAEGREAVVAQLRGDLPGPSSVAVKFAHSGSEGDSGWIAEELRIGGKTYVVTAAIAVRAGAWQIAALHWGEAMPNATAYRLAREGNLGVPDVIPNTNDGSELAKVMQTAFASKPSFVDARSTRPDAFNFGSASGERLKGGESIKKIFARINAVIRLHDAVKVGMLGERGGWGVANVDFTDADRDGTEVTQTFRVLAVWVKEAAGWRIVQTQWSNAR
jgi:ketosteroid isomerase-like protein